jgi:filamentous hemagglutinin family protein
MKRVNFILVMSIGIYLTIDSPVWGQSAIVPDATLGTNNSTTQDLTIRNLPSTLIQGGSSQGANLFHSFLRFNVPVGRGAYFANPDGIKNIFSRVTGVEGSEIFGRLGVLGDANLFLMNPNGILFGQTGSLDVNGSFVATTANAIQFGDRGSFDTTNPPNSVLTVDPSAFVFTQVPTGKIVNRSIAYPSSSLAGLSDLGLWVPDGKQLLFVGGDIELDSGILNSQGGRIELAGLAEPGTIEVSSDLRLNVPQNQLRANLNLSNDAQIAIFSNKGGEVSISANRLTATGGGRIYTSPATGGEAVNITVNASDIEFAGFGTIFGFTQISSGIYQYVSAKSGNLNITARSIKLLNGGTISSFHNNAGKGANFQINAKSIELVGRDSNLGSRAFIGNAGDVVIITDSLSIRDGASLSTSSFGQGRGGNLQISAKSIELTGLSSGRRVSSLSSESRSNSEFRSNGDAGDIVITTDSLSIRDGAYLSTRSFGRGQGGNLHITAKSIELVGTTSSEILSAGANSGLGSAALSSGRSGDVTLITDSLIVRDGAFITTDSGGQGQAGNLRITASSINLYQSAITSLSIGEGNAGDIQIQVSGRLNIFDSNIISGSTQSTSGLLSITANSIRLRGDSNIRTDTRGTDRKGGDINLTARDYILALEDSDILAFSLEGQGGNITLNTPAFLSIPRYFPTLNRSPVFLDGNNRVDVNATGTVGGVIAGVPDITFLQNALNPLAQGAIDTNTLLARSCIVRDRTTGAFFIKGSGGLPIRPGDLTLAPFPTGTIQSTERSNSEIIEPQGVYQLADGRYIMSRECQ